MIKTYNNWNKKQTAKVNVSYYWPLIFQFLKMYLMEEFLDSYRKIKQTGLK